jgi:head-tail adaptor
MTTRGERIHRVRFEQPGVPVPDGSGGYTHAWTPINPYPWFVAIRPATARDLETATPGTTAAAASHIVTGDYHAGVKTTSRMVRLRDNRIFQVDGKNNDDERDRTMTLFATELLDPNAA